MINLLPPEEKEILLKEQLKRSVIILGSEITFLLVCLILILFSVKFYILGQSVSQKFYLEQLQLDAKFSELSGFKDIALQYNQYLARMDSFYQNQAYTSSALGVLLDIERPEGLYFTNLSFSDDPANKKVKIVISGQSGTRDNLMAFKKNIEAQSQVKNVSFSPESWISQKNVNFSINLEVPKNGS